MFILIGLSLPVLIGLLLLRVFSGILLAATQAAIRAAVAVLRLLARGAWQLATAIADAIRRRRRPRVPSSR